jgi:hypothetical protein
MHSQTSAQKGTGKTKVSNLTIINSPLPIVLRSYNEAIKILTTAEKANLDMMFCRVLKMHRTYQKFEDKLSYKNKEAIRILLTELDHEIIDQISNRKEEIRLSSIEALGALLRRVPYSIWKDDFPMMNVCAEA